ncbi:MAG TPA: hypothetical protein VGB85_03340 [Nannocystis sp.]|jgi:hypothetical protein
MRKLCGLLPLLGLYFGFSATTQAADVTRVASSFDGDNKFDLHFGVGYDFNFKKAALLREWSDANNPSSTVVRDLLYQQFRHVVTPSMEIGLYKDLAVFVNVPIVVSDNRTYSFDQEADPCRYGDNASLNEPATCVNHDNSTTIRDGIIPRGGFDATEPNNPYNQFGGTDTKTIFKGATRRGVDQLHVGLKYALLNQSRLSHMPNWVIALEGRFAIGKPMTFSRDTMGGNANNTSVGRGMHELGIWTSLSRRYRFLDPFFTAWWYQAIRANNTEFQKFTDGAQDRVNPQSQTGVTFGTEIVPFERKAKGQKVAVVIRGLAMLKYNGRGYSEGWELFSDSPALIGSNAPGSGTPCTNQNARDAADWANDPANIGNADYIAGSGAPGSCSRFNGITNIQDFATFGINVGLNFQLSRYAMLMFGVDSRTDTRHWISNASRGKASLSGDPNLVEPNTKEVNPVRRDVIDNVGRRYAVGDVLNVMGYFRFLLTF